MSRSDDSPGGTVPWDETDEVDSGYLLERAITAASVVLVAVLLGYLTWQALVTPAGAAPVATVEAVESIDGSGGREAGLRVSVRLSNRGEKGLSSAHVTVTCGNQSRTLEFTHVPAGGHKSGTVSCPTGTDPQATATAWIEA